MKWIPEGAVTGHRSKRPNVSGPQSECAGLEAYSAIESTSLCLPDGVVVKGRKSKVVPLCLTLAGVVLLVVNGLLPATAGYEDLKSALVLFGGVIFATGVLLLLVRLFGDSGVPLYGENRVPLVWSERYYPKSAASAVADCLTRHDWARLRSIAQSQVPAIRLVAYHTPDEGFVACQAFEYVELEERPLTELHIVRSGHEA